MCRIETTVSTNHSECVDHEKQTPKRGSSNIKNYILPCFAKSNAKTSSQPPPMFCPFTLITPLVTMALLALGSSGGCGGRGGVCGGRFRAARRHARAVSRGGDRTPAGGDHSAARRTVVDHGSQPGACGSANIVLIRILEVRMGWNVRRLVKDVVFAADTSSICSV